MNREKDFHVKSTGVVVNINSRDFNRARRRNRIMKETQAALGEGGKLKQVVEEVVKINNAPSRAEKRVNTLEDELKVTKKLNVEMNEKLNAATAANEEIKRELAESNKTTEYVMEQFEALKLLVENSIGSK